MAIEQWRKLPFEQVKSLLEWGRISQEDFDAYRADLLALARWVFSLGGTFADLSAQVGEHGHAIIQLAYLGGSHESLEQDEISAPGNHAGIFGGGAT